MSIAPAGDKLQRVMQFSNLAVAAYQQPAPNHWSNLANPNMELVNFNASLVGYRHFSLANNRWTI